MADRLALLPLTGAGETHCEHCEQLNRDRDAYPSQYWCDVLGHLGPAEHPSRLPECLATERDAARLRAVAVAARALLDAWEAPYVDAEEELRRCMGPILALRAALKEL